jgi:hypothetical protein
LASSAIGSTWQHTHSSSSSNSSGSSSGNMTQIFNFQHQALGNPQTTFHTGDEQAQPVQADHAPCWHAEAPRHLLQCGGCGHTCICSTSSAYRMQVCASAQSSGALRLPHHLGA